MKKFIVICLFTFFSVIAFCQSSIDSTLQQRLDTAGMNLKGFATFEGLKYAALGTSAILFISSQGVSYDLLKDNLQTAAYALVVVGILCEINAVHKVHAAGKLLIQPTGIIFKFGH